MRGKGVTINRPYEFILYHTRSLTFVSALPCEVDAGAVVLVVVLVAHVLNSHPTLHITGYAGSRNYVVLCGLLVTSNTWFATRT